MNLRQETTEPGHQSQETKAPIARGLPLLVTHVDPLLLSLTPTRTLHLNTEGRLHGAAAAVVNITQRHHRKVGLQCTSTDFNTAALQLDTVLDQAHEAITTTANQATTTTIPNSSTGRLRIHNTPLGHRTTNEMKI